MDRKTLPPGFVLHGRGERPENAAPRAAARIRYANEGSNRRSPPSGPAPTSAYRQFWTGSRYDFAAMEDAGFDVS